MVARTPSRENRSNAEDDDDLTAAINSDERPYGRISTLFIEIGVRITLGAAPGSILALVLSEGITLAFAGVVAGLSAVLLLTRYLKAMLYGVSATDPLTLLAVSLVLIVAAVIAVWLPAHRAASVDPMVALRYN